MRSPSRLRRLVAAGVIVALNLVGACGFLIDTDGLVRGAFADASLDVEASVPDTSSSLDDAAVDAQDGGCGGGHEFCVDFDDGRPPDTEWTGSTGSLTIFTLDSDASVSPPLSANVVAASNVHGTLRKRFLGPLRGLTCSFDFRADYEGDVGISASPVAAQFLFDTPADSGLRAHAMRYYVGARINVFQLYRDIVGTGVSPLNVTLAAPIFGKWYHVVIEADFEANLGRFYLGELGQKAVELASVELHAPPTEFVDFDLGVPYVGMAIAPTGRHFDNVACDGKR